MTCRFCRQYNSNAKSTFITGSTSYDRKTLGSHWGSDVHKFSLDKFLQDQRSQTYMGSLGIKITEENERLVPIFNYILYLSQEGIALKKCVSLHQLVEENVGKDKISLQYRNLQ